EELVVRILGRVLPTTGHARHRRIPLGSHGGRIHRDHLALGTAFVSSAPRCHHKRGPEHHRRSLSHCCSPMDRVRSPLSPPAPLRRSHLLCLIERGLECILASLSPWSYVPGQGRVPTAPMYVVSPGLSGIKNEGRCS